jgi:hypothetical protein
MPIRYSITSSKRSVAFFKRETHVHRSSHPRMIRALLDRTADMRKSSTK